MLKQTLFNLKIKLTQTSSYTPDFNSSFWLGSKTPFNL